MSSKIKQIYHHYNKWEDFKNGLFDTKCDNFDEKITLSIELLKDQDMFYKMSIEMIDSWVYSSEQNLSDNSINKRAWIGQATCCFSHGSPEFVTKQAWWELDEEDRIKANKTADKAIKYWKEKNIMKGSLWGKLD